jgi:FlaG/FlaF family flagellin (archaellin)
MILGKIPVENQNIAMKHGMTLTPDNEKAAAELVGALVLISIIMVVIAIVAVGIFSKAPPAMIPAVDVQFTADSNAHTITIYHKGGDPIPKGQWQVLVNGTVFSNPQNSNPSGSWTIGDTLNVTDSKITPNTYVAVVYVSGGSGSYLLATNGTTTVS